MRFSNLNLIFQAVETLKSWLIKCDYIKKYAISHVHSNGLLHNAFLKTQINESLKMLHMLSDNSAANSWYICGAICPDFENLD